MIQFCTPDQKREIFEVLEDVIMDGSSPNKESLEHIISNMVGIPDFKLEQISNDEGLVILIEQIIPNIDLSNTDRAVIPYSNVIKNVKSYSINDLFQRIPMAKAEFEGYIMRTLLGSGIIGKGGDSYNLTNEALNQSFSDLKAEIFKDIQNFLRRKRYISNAPVELFNSRGIVNYKAYESVMNLLSDYFYKFNPEFDLLYTEEGKPIPNLNSNVYTGKDIREAYYNMILLNNFDSVITTRMNQFFKVNINKFNQLNSSFADDTKYSLAFDSKKTAYWSKGDHASESAEGRVDDFTKNLITLIPLYYRSGGLSNQYMEVNDFYLIATKINEFELLHGNKLRRSGEAGFQYFNHDPQNQFKWYLTEIKKAVNKELGSVEGLSEIFAPIYDKIYSLDKFINESEYNIAEKEAQGEGSILNFMVQQINNHFGSMYSVYNSDGNYQIQSMYNQDFNATRVQSTLFSTMKVNVANKSFYDIINDTTEKNKFEALFPANIDEIEDFYQAVEWGEVDYRKINSYIKDKTGILMTKSSLLLAIKDSQKYSNRAVTGSDFKALLGNMITEINRDFSKKLFKSHVSSLDKNEAVQLDSTIGKYVAHTIKEKFFISLRNAYTERFTVKAVMNVNTSGGNPIPTFKVGNLTYKDTESYELQREFEKANPNNSYKSLLLGDKPAIIGTVTKLEVVGEKRFKAYDKLTPREQFEADFRFDFIQNIINNNNFSVVIGNYSDKSTILAKVIDGNFSLDDKTPIVMESIDNILGAVREQGYTYYKDSLIKVFADYSTIMDEMKINHSLSLNVDEHLEPNIEQVNEFLASNELHDISKAVAALQYRNSSDLNIQLTSELHYSTYKGGIQLNSFLLDNFRIFKSPELFNEFVKRTEASSFGKLGINEFKLDSDSLSVIKAFGLKDSDFKHKKKKDGYTTIQYEDGTYNPLFRKWLWSNALFRNEYLFMTTKGEYMHPHGMRGSFDARNGDFSQEGYWDSYFLDMSKRLSAMAKRNVTNTASIESPVRNSKLGISDKINIAAISDWRDTIYTPSGHMKGAQDVHDGSSFINAVYSMMLDASFPGKGYSGTKKQFGTLTTGHGVTIKKDAESIITNTRIRESFNSKLPLIELHKKMLNIPIKSKVDFAYNEIQDYFAYKDGIHRQIHDIVMYNEGGVNKIQIKYSEGKWNRVRKAFVYGQKVNETIEYKTLYDLWDAIGGYKTIDAEGNFNEASNELLYKIVTEANNGVLKNDMIHVVSNGSALKAGAANVNGHSVWKNTGDISTNIMAYATYDSRFMGPQLDATSNAEGSDILEVSQVISAVAQGDQTSDLATSLYQDIAQVIQESVEKYSVYLGTGRVKDKQALYNILSNKFIQSIQRSDRDEVTKALIDGLRANGVSVPFSNQAFYNLFVRDVVTTLNNEFITRRYPGLGGVLIPSHGIFQIYDILVDGRWVTATQEDVMKNAIMEYSRQANPQPLNDQKIIDAFIEANMPDREIRVGEVELGDLIKLDINSEAQDLSSVKDYYDFKESYDPLLPVYKVNKAPRDLKPTLHTFTVTPKASPTEISNYVYNSPKFKVGEGSTLKALGTQQEFAAYINPILETTQLIDGQSTEGGLDVHTITAIDEMIESGSLNGDGFAKFKTTNTVTKNVFDLQPLKLLYKLQLGILNESETELLNTIQSLNGEDLQKILRGWLQRTYDLLEYNLLMPEVTVENVQSILENDNFTKDILADVILFYSDISDPITSIQFKPAEIIMGDVYKHNFNRGDNDSMYSIFSQGHHYFQKQLQELYNTDDTTDADLKIVTDDVSNPLYIKFVDKATRYSDVNIKNHPDVTRRIKSRFDDLGNKLYDIVDVNINPFIDVNGKEIIEIVSTGDFAKDMRIARKLVDSATNTRSLVPLNAENRVNLETELKGEDSHEKLSLMKRGLLSHFLDENLLHVDYKNINWFQESKDDILESLAKKMYISWEYSHNHVASRIPAQSMQSFMPMKNVAYIMDGSNDVYVNVHQIFLQGSDFDIDKAYILGNGFSPSGKMDLWTDVSSYDSLETLNELLDLPIPTGKFATLKLGTNTEGFIELQNIEQRFYASLENGKVTRKLSSESIKILNEGIRELNRLASQVKGDLEVVFHEVLVTSTAQEFIDLINTHNQYKNNRHRNSSLQNSVTHKINRVISSISNQLNANIPVDVGILHDAAARSQKRRGVMDNDINLNSYDMFSYYEQQNNASVGKEDVGIFANAMKGLLGLKSYFDDHAKNHFDANVPPHVIRQDYKTFNKYYSWTDDFGVEKSFRFASIADVQVSRAQEKAYQTLFGGEYQKRNTGSIPVKSSLISGATDNAKELIMAKINATSQLARMHAYMVLLGFELDDIVDFMTSKTSQKIIQSITDNIYEDTYPKSVSKELSKLVGVKGINQSQLSVFTNIYKDATEFSALTGLLGINQKRKADTWEMFNYLNRFSKILKTALSVIDLSESTDKVDDFTSQILEHNTVLDSSSKEDIWYIQEIYNRVTNFKLKNGETTNIMDYFNINYFIEDAGYRKATKDLYNLVKRTFNVFDVVESLPHFDAMINSLKFSHSMIKEVSSKYRFITDHLVKVLNEESIKLSEDKEPMYVSKRNLYKGAEYFDHLVTRNWLKTDRMGKFTLDVGQILKLTNNNSIIMYTSNDAKHSNKYTLNVTQEDNFVISLDTDYGIANFKVLMEQILVPYLQTLNTSEIVNSLKIETVTNPFGLSTNAIVSSYALQNLNSTFAIQQFESLITAFNALDTDFRTKGKIRNNLGNPLQWRDLFYLYNLIVNNNRYGDKRLTPLFRDYDSEPGSLSLAYTEYFNVVDQSLDSTMDQDLRNSPNYEVAQDKGKMKEDYDQRMVNTILFYAFQRKGTLENLEGNVTNPDFMIVSDIEGTVDNSYEQLREILNKVDIGGFLIEFIC